jgi:hypothetical protein
MYNCSCEFILCHKKCHERFLQLEKSNEITTIQSETIEVKRDDSKTKENEQNLINQVQNTSLVVKLLQINP